MTKFLSHFPKVSRQQLGYLAGALMLSLIIGYLLYSPTKRPPQQTAAIVTAEPVKVQDMDNFVNLIATVDAYESVTIKSRLDSQITKVAVTDGQKVTAGDVLFVLDDRILTAQLQQLQATRKSNEAEVERTKNLLERDTNLSGKGVRSKQDYDNSLSASLTAAANLEGTKALITSVETLLDFTVIKAPISGQIGTIRITLGNTVKANDTIALATINKITPIKARISVPQRYYDQVNAALNSREVIVHARTATGEIIETGKALFKENAIDDATRTLTLVASFQNDKELLWPGMFIDVSVVLGQDQGALTVPLKAVLPGQDQDYIFIVADNKAVRKAITVVRTQGDIAIIKGDIKADDLVIIDGLLRVRDGRAVTLSKPKQPQTAKEDQK